MPNVETIYQEVLEGWAFLIAQPVIGSTVSTLEIVWISIGLFTFWQLSIAYDTAMRDIRALRLAPDYQPNGPREIIVGADRQLVLGIGYLALVSEIIGVILALTAPFPPPPPLLPRGPSAMLLPVLGCMNQVIIAFIANLLVSSRAEWLQARRSLLGQRGSQ